MNSYNHYAYGAVAEWMYRYGAGIDTVASDPGFHTIALHPNFDPRLGSLSFSYDSTYGTITSSWKATGNDVVWNVTVPPNSIAMLDSGFAKGYSMTIDGQPLGKSSKAHARDANRYELPAGTYAFKLTK
jgi:alpha-L-rhamnosidase